MSFENPASGRIEKHRHSGGTTAIGESATYYISMCAHITALRFEMKCPGMQLTRGPSALARAKKITGLRSNDRQIHIDALEQLKAKFAANVVWVEPDGTESTPDVVGTPIEGVN